MSIFQEGYTMPKAPGKYMKFEEGENIFRILDLAISGWEYWTDKQVDVNGKSETRRVPNRVKSYNEVPETYLQPTDPRQRAKRFMAFKVYNYKAGEAGAVQVLEITQAGIMRALEALGESKRWGDPRQYDITVNRVQTGKNATDVEYSVVPNPKEQFMYQVEADAVRVKLEALFEGGDPFAESGQDLSDEFLADEAKKIFNKDA